MTITIKEYKVYTIESHPNPELCFEWIRDNWYDLGDSSIQDSIESLEAFSSHIGAKLDYSISIVPDRGEYVRFEFSGELPSLGDITIDLDLSGNCPFTGVCYDETILDAFRESANDASATLNDVLRDVEYRMLKTLHDEGDYIYSDEGLKELCEANEYQFKECGEIDS